MLTYEQALKDLQDYSRKIERLTAEIEEWKDETNYYQAEARKLRTQLAQAKTMILAARVLMPHSGPEYWPFESWMRDADKFVNGELEI